MNLQLFESHSHWRAVLATLKALHSAGYEAYLAGGCVRDLLIGRNPKDFDIATNARPDQIEALFPNTESVGKSFGVILVKQDGLSLEVATFRQDLNYSDGRRPDKVAWATIKEDSSRRDFTINAMYFDLQKNKIIDLHGGVLDIKNKIIRTVGDAKKRFEEDYLRILRALRFSSQLGFEIDNLTFIELKKIKSKVKNLPKERIYPEIKKILESERRDIGLYYLKISGIFTDVFRSEFWVSNIMLHQQKVFLARSYSEIIFTLTQSDHNSLSLRDLIGLGFSQREAAQILKWKSIFKNIFLGNIFLALKDMNTLDNHSYLRLCNLSPKKISAVLIAYEKACVGESVLPSSLVTGKDLLDKGFTGNSIGLALDKALEDQWLRGITDKNQLLSRLGAL